jgi:hypothetical protein
MKKTFLLSTILLLSFNVKSQGIIANIFNSSDSTWSLYEQNTPTNTYGNRLEYFHQSRTRTKIYKDLLLDNYKSSRNDGAISGDLSWIDASGNLKRSPVSSLTLTSTQITNALDTINKVMTVKRATDSISAINTKVNGKASASTTITINGTAQNLSANRTWNVGDVLTSGSYSDPSWINAIAWSKITGAPSFLTTEVDGSATNEIELPTQTGQSGKVLSTNGSTPSWITPATSAGLNNFTAYASGTVYSLTNSSAKVDFGTTDPTITITTPGTYLILTGIKVEYAGVTTLATQTCNFKLRRTNNTAADLANASTNFNVPVVTLLTQTGGDCDINGIIYTTSNSNDIIEMWGNRGANLSAGNINVGEASIIAIRIY